LVSVYASIRHCHHRDFSRLILFFFTAPTPTQVYTLSLHDALPISSKRKAKYCRPRSRTSHDASTAASPTSWVSRSMVMLAAVLRSEEHTSELQSRGQHVCRLLLEKKKAFTLANEELEKMSRPHALF